MPAFRVYVSFEFILQVISYTRNAVQMPHYIIHLTLPVHLKKIKNIAPSTRAPSEDKKGVEAGSDEQAAAALKIQRAFRGTQAKKMGKGIERMVTCYCCGRGYSTASLPRHIEGCPEQRKNNYKSLPDALKPPMPQPPTLPMPTDESEYVTSRYRHHFLVEICL
jgi:hypothetical protein